MFDTLELQLHEAEKARRRRRYQERTGSVHQRRNSKDRRREALNGNTKRGCAARVEATDRGNW